MADLRPVDDKLVKEIKEMLPVDLQTSINAMMIKQAFMVSVDKKGNPLFYVKRPGLLIFMEEKFRKRKAKYSMKAVPPDPAEEERIRRMLRIADDEPFVVMKGIVEIEYENGKKEVFVDYGTASPKDCYHHKLLEMASTRATNRAMRMATSLGFTSVEELPEENGSKTIVANAQTYEIVEGETTEPVKEKKITDKTRNYIFHLIGELADLAETNKEEILEELKDEYGFERLHEIPQSLASKIIEDLQQRIQHAREMIDDADR